MRQQGALEADVCIVHILRDENRAEVLAVEERNELFEKIEFALSVFAGSGVAGGMTPEDKSKGALDKSKHTYGEWIGGKMTEEAFKEALEEAATQVEASKTIKTSFFSPQKRSTASLIKSLQKNLTAVAAGLYFGVHLQAGAGHTQRARNLVAEAKFQIGQGCPFKTQSAFANWFQDHVLGSVGLAKSA